MQEVQGRAHPISGDKPSSMLFHIWETFCHNRDLWLDSCTGFMHATATPDVQGSDLFLQVTLLPRSLFQAMHCSHALMHELLLPGVAAWCCAASCYSETINSLLVITIMLHLYLVIGEHLLPQCWLEKPGALQCSLLGSCKGLRLSGFARAVLQCCYCCSAANNQAYNTAAWQVGRLLIRMHVCSARMEDLCSTAPTCVSMQQKLQPALWYWGPAAFSSWCDKR